MIIDIDNSATFISFSVVYVSVLPQHALTNQNNANYFCIDVTILVH